MPGWCFVPCDARGSRCEAEYDCCVLFGEEWSAPETGGCEFANDSFRDLGMVKVRTVMVKKFQSGERRRYQGGDRQELQSTSVEVMTILEVVGRHWTQQQQRCGRKRKRKRNASNDAYEDLCDKRSYYRPPHNEVRNCTVVLFLWSMDKREICMAGLLYHAQIIIIKDQVQAYLMTTPILRKEKEIRLFDFHT